MLFFRFILDIVFPPSILSLQLRKMDENSFLCAIPASFSVDSSTSTCRILSRYKNPLVHEAIWQMKFRGNAHATRILAVGLQRLIAKTVPLDISDLASGNCVLIPVPASKKRIRTRGFDQCRRLAMAIIKIDPTIQLVTDVLQKIKSTPEQKGQNRADRLVNLQDSFQIRDDCLDAVRGKYIILIDDVLTTGATLHECERVLLAAGAKRILSFALAH